jgi:hypothetical protein
MTNSGKLKNIISVTMQHTQCTMWMRIRACFMIEKNICQSSKTIVKIFNYKKLVSVVKFSVFRKDSFR